MMRKLVLVILLLAVAACDNKSPPPDLIKAQRQSMDKAKGVEQVLQQSTEQRREPDEQSK
jgi:outer membrane PBP1 activator LpoA protein